MSPLATYLIETFVTLAAVILIAFIVLFGAKRLGIARSHGPLLLVGRMSLDARRAVYLVQVANRVLIVGSSEAGLTSLGELSKEELQDLPLDQAPKPTFSQLLALSRLRLSRKPQPAEHDNEESKGDTSG